MGHMKLIKAYIENYLLPVIVQCIAAILASLGWKCLNAYSCLIT